LKKAAQEAKEGSAESGICEHCVSGEQKKYTGAGKEIQFDGLDAYINGPDSAKTAVIVNSDLFGWKAPNARAIVDKVANAGHLAMTVDLFRGMVWEHGTDFSPANLGAFFSANPDERVQADIVKACSYLQKKKISQIGIMGFCWGGRQAFNASTNGLVKAAVSFHGGGVSDKTCKDVKCPVFIIQAGLDNYPSLAVVEGIKKGLEALNKEVQLKVFPDVNHGFGIRADSNDKHATKQAELAFQDAIQFLGKKLSKL